MEFLKGKKTYILGIGAVLTAIGGYMTGALTMPEAITAAWAGFTSMALRGGIG